MYASIADMAAAIICGTILYLSVEAPFSLMVRYSTREQTHKSFNLSPVSSKI